MHPTEFEDPVRRLSQIDTAQLPADGGERYNRLIFEKSPYLLQHAENPVDWYPWGEAAFARAAAEDKPVFLSIGYSTCHWCHVMAHESFEDTGVANLLKGHFIAVKVDREERPDIDATYLAACQMLSGSSGWPATLFLTPGKKPFFAATYLPKRSHNGMAGLLQILAKIAELWQSERPRLLQAGDEVLRALQPEPQPRGEEAPLVALPLQKAFAQYLQTFDRQHAGFGSAPKFPAAHNLSLLFRLWRRSADGRAKTMALQTLQAIRLGGIFDQIGFGLHRYAVDARWLVPHFEKMLYDQALAAQATLDAFLVTEAPFFAQTTREILDYVLRDLADAEGGFYCGEDADSAGAEGAFYLWTPAQVREVLGKELGTIVCRSYDITEEGHLEGKSIPHLEEDVAALADRVGVDAEELAALLEEGRRRLLAVRQGRARPHRDDKILTSWNGLAIAALARAGAHLGEARYRRAARRAAEFILTTLHSPEGRLLRRFRQGEAAVPAFLEDYAFFGWGLLELYQADFDTRHLVTARALVERMETLFGDGEGGYFDTGADAETALVRGQTLQDGALPSGTSITALILLRLGRLIGDPLLVERGERLLRLRLNQVARFPSAYGQFLMALDFALGPVTEVVLAGDDGAALEDMVRRLRRRFLPRTVILRYRPGDRELEKLAPAVQGKTAPPGQAIAFVCRDQTCLEPARSAEALEKLLPG